MQWGIGIALAGMLLLVLAFAFGRKSADPLKAVLVTTQEFGIGLPAGFPDLTLNVRQVPVENPHWVRLSLTNASDRYISPQDFAGFHISAVMHGSLLLAEGDRSPDARLAMIEREPVQVHWGPGTLGPGDMWEAEFLFDRAPRIVWAPPQGRHRIALIDQESGAKDPGPTLSPALRPIRDLTHVGVVGTWVGAGMTAVGTAVTLWLR